jgi:glycosyltransferase involved in cell wall biosynthesis
VSRTAFPPLAIGLPVRNGAAYLAEALESILGQTFTEFTVLVSDNASTDATPDIVADYRRADSRVSYVRQPVDLGAIGNFNDVFWRTEGEFFKWAAADDVLAPTFLDRCLAELRDTPDVAAVCSAIQHIDAVGNQLRTSQDLRGATSADPVTRFADFVRYDYDCGVNFGVQRREHVRRTRLLLPFWGSDRVYLAELALHGRFVVLPEPLLAEREHDAKLSTQAARHNLRGFSADHGAGSDFLTWRHATELVRAVRAAQLTSAQRERAYAVLGRWAARNRVKFARSLVRGAATGLAGALPARSAG